MLAKSDRRPPVKDRAYFSGAKSIPPGFTPLNLSAFSVYLGHASDSAVYPACPVAPADGTGVGSGNRTGAYLTGVAPTDGTGDLSDCGSKLHNVGCPINDDPF